MGSGHRSANQLGDHRMRPIQGWEHGSTSPSSTKRPYAMGLIARSPDERYDCTPVRTDNSGSAYPQGHPFGAAFGRS